MKRILVTGGAGFIGSHLCERLLEQGNEVICVDNFFTGNKQNVVHLLDNPYFELMRHDVCFPLYVEVDEIYNLACPASPIHYQHDPVQTTKTSVHGAINMLGLAKRVKAKILQASTSEVYGDPTVHPQPEGYWGNVNCIGPRSCYDEGKRCAETLFFDYHRQHNLRIKVARIFNSLTGDQKVIYYRHGVLHHESFEECYRRIGEDVRGIKVPSFSEDGSMALRPVSAIWRHKVKKRGFRIATTWGRSVKITEDHSLFTRAENGSPQAAFGRDLQVGDLIAIPRKIPAVERALEPFLISDRLEGTGVALSVVSDWVATQCECREEDIRSWLQHKGVSSRQHFAKVQRFRESGRVPMALWQSLEPDSGVEHGIAVPGSAHIVKNRIKDLDALLWFLGFYLAEGCLIYRENSDYQLLFSSNLKYLNKLIGVVEELFGLRLQVHWSDATRAPSVHLRSRVVVELVVHALDFGHELSTRKTIPDWVLQLPLAQLKHFLLGFWEGDGNHDAETTGNKLIFNSSSPELMEQLVFALGRFGIIGSVSEFQTRASKDSDKWFTARRITVQGLDDYDISRLDEARQTLQAQVHGDLAWARVRAIDEFEIDDWVYDFSVPGDENFVGGTYGVCCHNTYGPRMHPHDGRVVSNFIVQALQGEPITIYGDGSQTRSFCYVDDLVDGLIRLMESPDEVTGPINLGNPGEFTMLELAERVLEITGSRVDKVFHPLPVDDPRQRQPDIGQAKALLDWQPVTPLEAGLVSAVEYFSAVIAQSAAARSTEAE